ncbi:MAG: bifunctional proline dehydrogenase/L-glutamate gamma-semialdehyde dehydrogenase PutA [Hyphomicrobiaceae bacterium]|nr:bifunctional proline dehydrogenase/L-glutamate gamma-semialdehyde dehydrogenase PutA [Hyphomicrobiaceae bacterium]
MRGHVHADEQQTLRTLIKIANLAPADRKAITARAIEFVETIRSQSGPRLLESFLDEYGLTTREGIALMCLAEALLRVPDAETIDALIEDKIAPSDWGRHLGQSSSSLVNASTWALLLTGKVLEDDDEGLIGALHGAVKRLSEPVIRVAVSSAIKELGNQFVLGRNIEEAMERAQASEKAGYTYSYDMLGEAACTADDAARYAQAYSDAIEAIGKMAGSQDIRDNPGISVKLSALHPRYEYAKHTRVLEELVPRTVELAQKACAASLGFNIDAEEADRLDISLDVIEAVLSDPSLANWDGFGVVVQAYGPRASHFLDWLYALACKLDRKIMVRLVKGAYWDTEIKHAQTLGLGGFPVFTRKATTDVSYIANARKLLGLTDRIYPQFATHNAHTAAAILHMAGDHTTFEFQRLHGMGDALHDHIHNSLGTRCRIYAPVGAHKDLLAYLVRRLLENGANSSFVNQIVDEEVAPEEVASDPFLTAQSYADDAQNPHILSPPDLFRPARMNSRGWDLTDPLEMAQLHDDRDTFAGRQWHAEPILAAKSPGGTAREILNPAKLSETVGVTRECGPGDIETALSAAATWDAPAAERTKTLMRAADLYEQHACELFALAAREAGKALPDCVSEVREAVDFLRYYASQIEELGAPEPCGLFVCISPWNFPVAIFTGQIAAALAAGNGVLAKPAEATPLIASRAIRLLHEAGVPVHALQFLPGDGPSVGSILCSDLRVGGVCFTGSTETAQIINRAMASNLHPAAPLIAETGGINAMIVDSTALPEQAVRDIVSSAFQSAGQRCSALRVLYLQEDVAETMQEMLFGAMDQLSLGDPWHLSTDIGPVIDKASHERITSYIDEAREAGMILKELTAPPDGHFIAPTALKVSSIADVKREIFGPVLHVATFAADEIEEVMGAINAAGYGLTFGLHSRIDDRVQEMVEHLRVGNIYVNRNQIGAVVGSQPFGGEGLSGTGPKAGGPNYVKRFTRADRPGVRASRSTLIPIDVLQSAIDARLGEITQTASSVSDLPGPTGESNRLSLYPRGFILCAGPDADTARSQAEEAHAQGCSTLLVAPGVDDGLDGVIDPLTLTHIEGIQGVAYWGPEDHQRAIREALANRDGALVPLICERGDSARYFVERHVCVDTTASGGNAALLAASD